MRKVYAADHGKITVKVTAIDAEEYHGFYTLGVIANDVVHYDWDGGRRYRQDIEQKHLVSEIYDTWEEAETVALSYLPEGSKLQFLIQL